EDEFETAPWEVPKVVDFLKDTLDTLAFVHEHQVIHRDLKPSNLIRRNLDNHIVLIDFGAVKQVGTQPAATGISHTISIGTQGYMPSEQLAGQPKFSSDVYAVGMMGIQALTGQLPKYIPIHPQTGELDWHSYARHIHPELVTVLDTMVRYDFRTRYPSAREALNALQSLPQELQQYILPAPVVSVETEPAPSVSEPTGLTIPAMGTPPAVAEQSSEVADPPRRRKLPMPVIIAAGLFFMVMGVLLGRAYMPIERPPAVTGATSPEDRLEDSAVTLTPAVAQTVITDFYADLSNQDWDQAKARTSDAIAQQFDPNFFQKFQQVSVENLTVTAQTPESIEFLGQNTYLYNDGSTQKEERTFTVQLVNGQPRIVDSAFIKVTKSR
ncbi:MAG: protein kinase, partial [Cyanobacteria bacterium P01_F01_bin.116]